MSRKPDPPVAVLLREFRMSLVERENKQTERMAYRWHNYVHPVILDAASSFAFSARSDKDQGAIIDEKHLAGKQYYQSYRNKLKSTVLSFMDETALPDIKAEQRAYVDASLAAAIAAINIQYRRNIPSYGTVDPSVFDDRIGLAGNGEELALLLHEAFPNALNASVLKLIEQTNMEVHPNEVSNNMTNAAATALALLALIGRTEQIRLTREALMMQYLTSGVVIGYRRMAVKDINTCMACLLADGDLYPIGKTLEEHPRGRCQLVPILAGQPIPSWEYGLDWFRSLPSEDQSSMMGSAKYQAWKEGLFDINRLKVVTRNAEWGPGLRTASLKELLDRA